MKKSGLLYFIVCGVAIFSIGCNDHSKHEDAHKDEKGHSADEIIIEPDDASQLGIKAEIINLQPFFDIVRVSGQIVASSGSEATVTASTPGIITLRNGLTVGTDISANNTIGSISAKNISGGDPNNAAKVAITNAQRNVDRLTPLLKEGIVTRREFDDAVATLNSAKAAYSPSAASGTVVSPISGVITQLFVTSGQYVDAGTPIASVSRSTDLMIRADVPERYRSKIGMFRSANFRSAYSDSWISTDSIGGRLQTVTTDNAIAQAGYIPLYFSVKNDGTLSAGSYVDICLISESSTPDIALPNDAIIEQQGNYFAYLKTGDHSYRKVKIEIGATDGRLTQISDGLRAGDNVVVSGAVMVKLAESSGNVPEGHTHNH